MQEERLYMPVDITTDKQIIRGYGKKQLKLTAKTALLAVTIALLIGGVSQSLFFTIFLLVIAIGISCMLHYKDGQLNLTAAEQIGIIIDYITGQKIYHYRYYDEWERDLCGE